MISFIQSVTTAPHQLFTSYDQCLTNFPLVEELAVPLTKAHIPLTKASLQMELNPSLTPIFKLPTGVTLTHQFQLCFLQGI